jgi:hypothetical protein
VNSVGARFPRLTLRMMPSGPAVQPKGFGSRLVSAIKRLMAAWRSAVPLNAPRLGRRRVSSAKSPSAALIQDAQVGVERTWKRGCRSSHARTFGCLWVA